MRYSRVSCGRFFPSLQKKKDGDMVSASFCRYNDDQYIIYPHDKKASRTLQIKKHKQYLILGLDINQPTMANIEKALSEVPDIVNLKHMNKTDSDGNKYPIHPVVVTALHTTALETLTLPPFVIISKNCQVQPYAQYCSLRQMSKVWPFAQLLQ